MNKILGMINIFIVIMMIGCSLAVPVTPKFPDVPVELMIPPSKLAPLSNAQNLSDILDNANTNYGTYYIISEKLLLWQEWYKQQQDIYNNIKE